MSSLDRMRRRPQEDSVPDPSRAIPTDPPPSFDEATSNEAPPPYDGVRLPPYAEAMLLDRDRPSTRTLLDQINFRSYTVQRETSVLVSQIREMQGNFPPNSHIFRRLDVTVINLRSLSDTAYLRQTKARMTCLRLQEQEMLLRHRPRDSRRGLSMRTKINQLQKEIADIHREVMAAPDDEEHLQIWRYGIAATQESLIQNEGFVW